MSSITATAKRGSSPLIIQSLLNLFNINNAPIPNSILTSLDIALALENLKGLVHPDTIRFIYRILSAMTSTASQEREGKRWNGEYLAIPQTFIRQAYHRDSWSEIPILIELRILQDNGYSNHPTQGRCKGYRVVWDNLVDVFRQPLTKDTPKTFIALTDSKRPLIISEIARDTEKTIPTGCVNLLAVIGYFNIKIDNNEDISNLLNEANNVFNCYLNQTNWNNKTGILTYKQHYHTTEIGGRVYGKSGDQFVNRELKTHWFNMLDTFNYDIKGAHIALVNQLYPTFFGTNWVNNLDDFRNKLAAKVGIPLKLMKQSVLALTYGALLTAHHKCEIYQLFLAHFGDESLAKAGLDRFRANTSEYAEALKCWFKDIRKNPEKYQTNAIGLKTTITDPKSLASHYLQGLEQEAIRWISSQFNQNRYRYKVISNQFDGLVTVGKIPDSILTNFQDKFKLTIEIKDIR